MRNVFPRSLRPLAIVVCMAACLVACSNSDAPAPKAAPAAATTPAAPTISPEEARANKELELYDQMRANQNWDLASALGDEILAKFATTPAAAKAKETLDDVHAKAATQVEARRLSRLWTYAAVAEAGGTQYTAVNQSKDTIQTTTSISKAVQRVRLVLRQHPKWGQSVYLLLDDAKFDCSKGCATLPISFDGAPPQRMKAVIPPTGEPALFIDDDKGFIAKMRKAKKVDIQASIKGVGAKSFSFEVGGFDPAKLPNRPK